MNLLTSLHHSLQGKDIAVEGADIITKRLFQRIQEAEKKDGLQDEVWETDLVNALRLCRNVERGATSAQAYVLAIIKKNWNDLSLPFRKNYDFSFDVFVMRETGIQPSTAENYLRAAETFFVNNKRPMGQIEIPLYDAFCRPIKQDGVVVTKYIEFDATQVPVSKLTLVRSLAEQNKMTPKLWSMLSDSQITVEALKKEIYVTPEGEPSRGDPSLRFTLEGSSIVAYEFGESVEIAELFYDMGDSDLGRSAIRRLLLILGIPYDEDIIAKQTQNARDTMIIRIHENGGNRLVDG